MRELKKLTYILLATLCMATLSSCEDDPGSDPTPQIYEILPFSPMIDIVNTSGQSYLSKDNPDNILGYEMTATIRDHTYNFEIVDPFVGEYPTYYPGGEPYLKAGKAAQPGHPSRTDMVPATFYGLYLSDVYSAPIYKQDFETKRYRGYLAFGQFHGWGEYHETITIRIPRLNREFKIEINSKLTWKDDKPVYEGKTYLNGVEQKSTLMQVVIPSIN